jgi:hypothetical protein
MAAKPLDIRIIRENIRAPDYSVNYSDPILSFLIKLQTFFLPFFFYSVPVGAGGDLQDSLLRGWQFIILDVFKLLTTRVVIVIIAVMMVMEVMIK